MNRGQRTVTSRARVCAFPAVLFAASALVWGQSGAQLTGQVSDKTGALVPNAQVTAKNVNTGIRISTHTTTSGYYVIPDLSPGDYELAVEMTGFRGFSRTGLRLEVSQVSRVDIVLEVGQMTERVEVVDTAPLLASNQLVDHLVDNKSIVEMPLNGRNAWDLVVLAPAAVAMDSIGDNGEIPLVAIGGGRAFAQSLQIDGAAAMKSGVARNQAHMSPMVDAVQEFRVLVNGYSAEFGRGSGGVFTAVTKSGTNQYHGNLFEFFRNDALNANAYFARTKPQVRFNQFGGTLGGPVRRDKTFFFGAMEISRNITGSPLVNTVPTEAFRRGDFSQLLNAQGRQVPVYDPSTATRLPYPGNVIPASQIDPVAAKVTSYYPLPNQPGTIAGANNFNVNQTPRRTQYHGTARVDHYFGAKDRVYARYINQSNVNPAASAYPEPAASGLGSNSRSVANYAHSGIVHYTRTVSARLLNELDFSELRQDRDILHPSVGGNWPEKLGLKGVDPEAFPIFRPAGFAVMGALVAPFRKQTDVAHHVSDTINYISGSHFVKAGFTYRKSGSGDKFDTAPSGDFTFNQAGTALTSVAGSGNGFATFLLGRVTSASVNLAAPLHQSSAYYGAFIQDDWKLTPRLTLNLGVRYEVEPSPLSRENAYSSFDMTAINPVAGVPGMVTFAGVGGTPLDIFDTDWNNIAPRIGLALRLGQSLVVRSGFGIFFSSPNDNGWEQPATAGSSLNTLLVTSSDAATVLRLQDGVKPYSLPGPEDRTPAIGLGAAVSFFERNRRSTYSEQFNLSVERVWKSMLLEARYLGNLGRKLTSASLSINQIRPELVGTSSQPQSVRPFPQYTGVSVLFPNLGTSAYHGLNLHAERRYRSGTQFSFNYTFSKFLDNVPNVSGGNLGATNNYEDLYNRRLDRGFSSNDIKHNVVFNAIWELPIGRGKRWLKSNRVYPLATGWQLSALTSLRSGAPFGSVSSVNNCACFSAGSMRPDLLRDPTLPSDQRSTERWFDTSAFAFPTGARFGTAGPAVARAPGLQNFNLSAMRNFAIRERLRLQFRGEFFNATNHVNLGNPATTLGNAAFGTISTARANRVVQLGLKVYF